MRIDKKKLVIIIVVLAILAVLVFVKFNGKYKLTNKEAVGYTSLRLAIAKSAYDGTGEITKENLDSLKSAVKSMNKTNTWFDNRYYGTFYGKNIDTSDNQIDILCDGEYCATFIVEHKGNDYYLIKYTFERSKDTGYRIRVNND